MPSATTTKEQHDYDNYDGVDGHDHAYDHHEDHDDGDGIRACKAGRTVNQERLLVRCFMCMIFMQNPRLKFRLR